MPRLNMTVAWAFAEPVSPFDNDSGILCTLGVFQVSGLSFDGQSCKAFMGNLAKTTSMSITDLVDFALHPVWCAHTGARAL